MKIEQLKQNKSNLNLSYEIIFLFKQSRLCFLKTGWRLYVFKNLNRKKLDLNFTLWNSILKSFFVTPSSNCRISAKSSFLVINMKSLCKHIPKVLDKNCFLIQKCKKWMNGWIMFISAKFSKWHFKCNILGKMIGLGNGCINLCPEKCILSQIPIAC